jgi:hypothetical protein
MNESISPAASLNSEEEAFLKLAGTEIHTRPSNLRQIHLAPVRRDHSRAPDTAKLSQQKSQKAKDSKSKR